MIPLTLALAERSVPRYTSYPTAAQFGAAVEAETYGAWLSALPAHATLSLYIHVPYCAELCLYCGCHTKAIRRDEPIAAYAERLAEEIALIAARAGGRRVVHLHWGGGTPSILGEARLIALATRLRRGFDLERVEEHAIELDPRRASRSMIRALREMGVNRVSLGVQDFSPHVQQAIGRVQPFAAVEETVGRLREVGIGKINFDLMYGLPRQSEHDVRRTIMLANALRPQRVAFFGYAHVPWFKPQQTLIDEATLPGAAERLAQSEAARAMLTGFGYQAVGLDHFAAPDDALALAARSGLLRRNFQGYTVDAADALIGIGASAISRLPQGFAQNAPAVGTYSRAVAAGRLATVKGLALAPQDRLRARIIERVMCDFAADVDALASGEGDAAIDFEPEVEALMPLRSAGLVEIDGRRIAVTEKGRPFVRLIASAFDAYLQRQPGRHSRAV